MATRELKILIEDQVLYACRNRCGTQSTTQGHSEEDIIKRVQGCYHDITPEYVRTALASLARKRLLIAEQVHEGETSCTRWRSGLYGHD